MADERAGRGVLAVVVAAAAGNLVHEALASTASIPSPTIGQTIHIHPTLGEGVNAAAGGIHQPSAE